MLTDAPATGSTPCEGGTSFCERCGVPARICDRPGESNTLRSAYIIPQIFGSELPLRTSLPQSGDARADVQFQRVSWWGICWATRGTARLAWPLPSWATPHFCGTSVLGKTRLHIISAFRLERDVLTATHVRSYKTVRAPWQRVKCLDDIVFCAHVEQAIAVTTPSAQSFLKGVNGAASGLVVAAAFLLLDRVNAPPQRAISVVCFAMHHFVGPHYFGPKLNAPLTILLGAVLGVPLCLPWLLSNASTLK